MHPSRKNPATQQAATAASPETEAKEQKALDERYQKRVMRIYELFHSKIKQQSDYTRLLHRLSDNGEDHAVDRNYSAFLRSGEFKQVSIEPAQIHELKKLLEQKIRELDELKQEFQLIGSNAEEESPGENQAPQQQTKKPVPNLKMKSIKELIQDKLAKKNEEILQLKKEIYKQKQKFSNGLNQCEILCLALSDNSFDKFIKDLIDDDLYLLRLETMLELLGYTREQFKDTNKANWTVNFLLQENNVVEDEYFKFLSTTPLGRYINACLILAKEPDPFLKTSLTHRLSEIAREVPENMLKNINSFSLAEISGLTELEILLQFLPPQEFSVLVKQLKQDLEKTKDHRP